MYNEDLQDYFEEGEFEPNKLQPEGWDEKGKWIGMREWRKIYGKKNKKIRRFRNVRNS